MQKQGVEKQLRKVTVGEVGGLQPNTNTAIALSLRWSLQSLVNLWAFHFHRFIRKFSMRIRSSSGNGRFIGKITNI